MKNKIVCSSENVFGPSDVIQSYSSTFDGQGFKISGMKLLSEQTEDVQTEETEDIGFGLIREMKNGGVIKNLTIENSLMNIASIKYAYNFGFFVGRASTSDIQGTGNITISDCHSINNTITITGNNVASVGFIAGILEINDANGPNILVSDCSTKYSNFISSAEYTYYFGGNFGHACLFFFYYLWFLILIFSTISIRLFRLNKWNEKLGINWKQFSNHWWWCFG